MTRYPLHVRDWDRAWGHRGKAQRDPHGLQTSEKDKPTRNQLRARWDHGGIFLSQPGGQFREKVRDSFPKKDMLS